MSFLTKIFGLFSKPASNEKIEKEAMQRGIQFVDSPSFKMNEGIRAAQDAQQGEVFNKSFFRPYSQDGEDAYTTPDTDTFRIRDGLGEDISVDSGRKPMEEDIRSAPSHNGREDVRETRDDLSDREDRQGFNLMGNGLRDSSVGYGREDTSLGYSNPFDHQMPQGNGNDPNMGNGQ
jgi:hypothetical protein